MADKKYYWLKLQKDFFKRHDIRVIEAMPNGKDYILFYLKLLVESVSHEGELRFSDLIPYSEDMLAVVTNTNVDVVKSAMSVFRQLNMIDVWDDSTIYMAEVSKLIGCETDWAKKKREYRLKTTEDNVLEMSDECPKTVLPMSDKSKSIDNRDKSKRKSKSIDIDYIKDYFAGIDDEKYSYDKNMLIEAFVEYWEMRRKSKKAVNSEYAFKRQISKLMELSRSDVSIFIDVETCKAILDQSTINGWTDLYPIKKENTKRSNDIASEWSAL